MPMDLEQPILQPRQRSVSRRASMLVAISGPYPTGTVLRGAPLARTLTAGARTSARMAVTAAPMEAVERRLAAQGRPPTADEVARRRRIKLAASVATVAAGVLAQRALNHSGRTGATVEAGRILTSQVAIGGAANAIILATDAVLRTDSAAQLSRRGQAATLGTMLVLSQRRLLNRAAGRLTLPVPPASTAIPVRGRWRVREVQLPVR